MTEAEVVVFVTALPGVEAVVASAENGAPEASWGDTFFFYGGERRMPFATIVTQDYEGVDTSSNLDRQGVFRVNACVSKETFGRLFPDGAAPPDPAALDTPFPHPLYGAQSWVSINNPGDRSAALARSLLVEAHERAAAREERRTRYT